MVLDDGLASEDEAGVPEVTSSVVELLVDVGLADVDEL